MIFLKKCMRVVAVLIVLSFCGGLHAKVAEAAEVLQIEQNYNPIYGTMSYTLVTYSAKNQKYNAHLFTYINGKLGDYTHRIFSGSGVKRLQGGDVPYKLGDSMSANGYVVK